MSYRYKQDFGKCFNDLPLPQNEGTISHPLIELDEVYRKAEAFDAIIREWEDERLTKAHILETIQKYYDEYESGGSDD